MGFGSTKATQTYTWVEASCNVVLTTAVVYNEHIGHKQSIADTCIYFWRNKAGELAIWLSWADDNLRVGPLHVIKVGCQKLEKEIEIEDAGKPKEFIGCKDEMNK